MSQQGFRIDYGITREKTARWPFLLAAVLTVFGTFLLCALARGAVPIQATVAGKTCPLAVRSFQTTPLGVDACGGFFLCAPGKTVYRATYELVVAGPCSDDRVFAGGFQ